MTAEIRVLRYLKNYSSLQIYFSPESLLEGFTDSDWARCKATRKSIGGHVFLIRGPLASWQAKGQTVVVPSTLGAELIAYSDGAHGAIWLKRLLNDLGVIDSNQVVPVYCDSQGAAKLILSSADKARIKHIDLNISTHVASRRGGGVQLANIESESDLADLFTKALPRPRHQKLTDMVRISECKNATEQGKRGCVVLSSR